MASAVDGSIERERRGREIVEGGDVMMGFGFVRTERERDGRGLTVEEAIDR